MPGQHRRLPGDVSKEDYESHDEARWTQCYILGPEDARVVCRVFLEFGDVPIIRGGVGRRCGCRTIVRILIAKWESDYKAGRDLKMVFGPPQRRVAHEILDLKVELKEGAEKGYVILDSMGKSAENDEIFKQLRVAESKGVEYKRVQSQACQGAPLARWPCQI